MGVLSEALRLQAETDDAEVRAKIGGLKPDELIGWCKAEIEAHQEFLSKFKGGIDVDSIIRRSIGDNEEEAATLNLAKEYNIGHSSLVNVVKSRRRKGKSIPVAWRDRLFEIYLGIEKEPVDSGRPAESIRDEAICRCIQHLIDYKPPLKATRNEASTHITSAADIVAKALGYIQFSAVAKIWKSHRRRLKSTDPV